MDRFHFLAAETLSYQRVKSFVIERSLNINVCICKEICVGFHHGGRNAYVSQSFTCTQEHTHMHTCLDNHVRYGDLIARSKCEMPLARTGTWMEQHCGPGEVTLGGRREPGVGCVAFLPTHIWPFPACCLSISCSAAGLSTWALIGFEPVASWEPVTLRLGPFQFSLFRRKFHPGSLQWLPRIRRTLGRLGYRTALKAVLGNLKRARFSLSYFKLHSSLPS